jgi:hypothetical protein
MCSFRYVTRGILFLFLFLYTSSSSSLVVLIARLLRLPGATETILSAMPSRRSQPLAILALVSNWPPDVTTPARGTCCCCINPFNAHKANVPSTSVPPSVMIKTRHSAVVVLHCIWCLCVRCLCFFLEQRWQQQQQQQYRRGHSQQHRTIPDSTVIATATRKSSNGSGTCLEPKGVARIM